MRDCVFIALLAGCSGSTSGPVDIDADHSTRFALTADAFATGELKAWSLAVADVDGDGALDVYANHHAARSTLMLGVGDGTFVDGSDRFVGLEPADEHGSGWADPDNDGDPDLLQLTGRGGTDDEPHRFWRNDGEQLVIDSTEAGLAQPGARGRNPLFVDIDRDGLLDVILTNEPREDGAMATTMLRGDGLGFGPVPAGNWTPDPGLPYLGHFLMDATGDGHLDIVEWTGSGVTVVTHADGLLVESGASLTMTRELATGLLPFDANGDGLQELLVLRGRTLAKPEFLRISDTELWLGHSVANRVEGVDLRGQSLTVEAFTGGGPATFFLGPDAEGLTADSVELDPDEAAAWVPDPEVSTRGRVDVGRTGNTWHMRVSDPVWTHFALRLTSDEPIGDPTFVGPQPGLRLEPVLMDRASGPWIDQSTGLEPDWSCREGLAADFDNDRDVDLYLLCSRKTANIADELWLNEGDGRFTRCEDCGADGFLGNGRSLTAVTADFDGNGFLDLVVASGAEEVPAGSAGYSVLLNEGNTNHWLAIDLIGTASNRDGIGARVELTAAGWTETRWADGGQHGPSSSGGRIHFGLGSATEVESLTVFWPSGVEQTVPVDAVDWRIEVVEP